jgi:hypothetical protein
MWLITSYSSEEVQIVVRRASDQFQHRVAVPMVTKANVESNVDSSKKELERFIRTNLLTLKEGEKGNIAICAAVYQEGRFITEWLLYVSLILVRI